jgi:hypothetical protein
LGVDLRRISPSNFHAIRPAPRKLPFVLQLPEIPDLVIRYFHYYYHLFLRLITTNLKLPVRRIGSLKIDCRKISKRLEKSRKT